VSGVRYDFPLAVLPRSFGQTLRFRIMTSAMMSVMATGMVVWNSGIGCDGVTPRAIRLAFKLLILLLILAACFWLWRWLVNLFAG